MINNEDLQRNIQDAIKWEPMLNAAEIGVVVKDGVVTLTGTVDSYAKKIEVIHATKRMSGVKAIIEEIIIDYGKSVQKSNADIATDVLNALKWDWEVPLDKIQVEVEDGWVTLNGVLEWNFQRESAQKAIKHLKGIKGITSKITIQSESNDSIEKEGILSALKRNWSINSKQIHVSVIENRVCLTGVVHSWYEKEEAERIVWNAPGVLAVQNDLTIIDYIMLGVLPTIYP